MKTAKQELINHIKMYLGDKNCLCVVNIYLMKNIFKKSIAEYIQKYCITAVNTEQPNVD